MSRQSGSWSDVIHAATYDHTAVASTASETSLIANTASKQPRLTPSLFLDKWAEGRVFEIHAAGIFSTTGTPTMTFKMRMGTSSGTSTLTGSSIGVSAAITTINNSANAYWKLFLEFCVRTAGVGTGSSTLSANGYVFSPAGFASTYFYPLIISQAALDTWTQTFDGSLDQWLNLSLTWSASSSSNTATCKSLFVKALV